MDNNNGKQRIYIDIEPNLFEALYSVEKIKLIASFKDDFIEGLQISAFADEFSKRFIEDVALAFSIILDYAATAKDLLSKTLDYFE